MKIPSTVLIVRNAPCFNHVRVKKFTAFFSKKNIDFKCLCWQREEREYDPNGNEKYILKGGGYSNKKLAFFYVFWVIVVFFHLVLVRRPNNVIILACDFDSALPTCLASIFRPSLKFVYDIHDDFSLRYKFPLVLKYMIFKIDTFIKRRAQTVIHVDANRVRQGDVNYRIIPNIPPPKKRKTTQKKHTSSRLVFGYAGLLSNGRGLESMYNFFYDNQHCKLILAGNIVSHYGTKLSMLNNVEYLGNIEQDSLFQKLDNCDALFCLYDPTLEINRLAASNKVYDALMLNKPVIINEGLLISDLVEEHGLGIVIPYNQGPEWDKILKLEEQDFKIFRAKTSSYYHKYFNYDTAVDDIISDIFSPFFKGNI